MVQLKCFDVFFAVFMVLYAFAQEKLQWDANGIGCEAIG